MLPTASTGSTVKDDGGESDLEGVLGVPLLGDLDGGGKVLQPDITMRTYGVEDELDSEVRRACNSRSFCRTGSRFPSWSSVKPSGAGYRLFFCGE